LPYCLSVTLNFNYNEIELFWYFTQHLVLSLPDGKNAEPFLCSRVVVLGSSAISMYCLLRKALCFVELLAFFWNLSSWQFIKRFLLCLKILKHDSTIFPPVWLQWAYFIKTIKVSMLFTNRWDRLFHIDFIFVVSPSLLVPLFVHVFKNWLYISSWIYCIFPSDNST
jgi:hypothetical protein